MVRIPDNLDCEDFLGSVDSTTSSPWTLLITPQFNELVDFPANSAYTLKQQLPVCCLPILLRPSASDNDYQIVQEYQPDVHRLRHSASS